MTVLIESLYIKVIGDVMSLTNLGRRKQITELEGKTGELSVRIRVTGF